MRRGEGASPRAITRSPRAPYRSDWALALTGALVTLAMLLAIVVAPYLGERRRVALEVPQPAPLFSVSLVEVPPGSRACQDQIGFLPGRQVAEMKIGTFGKLPSPLLLELVAPGYRQRIPVAPTYVDNGLLDIPVGGSPKVVEGRVCVTNRGHSKIALYAAADRTRSRSTTTVGGRLWPANFDLTFYAARPQSLLDRGGAIVRRLGLFHAHVGLWLLWLLCSLFVVGLPLASVAAVIVAHRRTRSAVEL